MMLGRTHDTRLPAWLDGAMLSLLRAVTGALFMQHGVQKLFGLLLKPDQPWNGPPAIFSQFWVAGILEVFGGALIVVGLRTRPVAFLLAGEMAVAFFQAHFPRSFWPILNGGEPVVLFCFVFLYLFAAGAGPYSVDAALRARRLVSRRADERDFSGVAAHGGPGRTG
jgi:putative oxidoreductase